MQTQEIQKLLDEVLGALEQAQRKATVDSSDSNGTESAPPSMLLPDAIDREVAAPPRQTAVVSLRNSPQVEQFRRELETESLTVTTATAFLQLLQQALQFFRIGPV